MVISIAALLSAYKSKKYHKTLLFLLVEDIFPNPQTEEEVNKKNRFLAYRSVVGWIYPNLRKGERKPLPACVYAEIQARFPPTADEEDYADWRFSDFLYK